MPYVRTIWVNDQTKLNADNMNNIEDGIVEAKNEAETAQETADSKVDKNIAITGATKTKITYDAKGLVTSGTDLEATDIPELPQSKITDLVTDLGNKQDTLTFDSLPTSGSTNPVTSGGVYTAISGGVPYLTTEPTSANTNGNLIIVVLTSEPATYYNGYDYKIVDEVV